MEILNTCDILSTKISTSLRAMTAFTVLSAPEKPVMIFF
jgi:hypothetical protein